MLNRPKDDEFGGIVMSAPMISGQSDVSYYTEKAMEVATLAQTDLEQAQAALALAQGKLDASRAAVVAAAQGEPQSKVSALQQSASAQADADAAAKVAAEAAAKAAEIKRMATAVTTPEGVAKVAEAVGQPASSFTVTPSWLAPLWWSLAAVGLYFAFFKKENR